MLAAGADKLAINTGIVKNPNLINQLSQSLGKQCVIASIQVRKSLTNKNWEVMIESGREKSEKNLTEVADALTDILYVTYGAGPVSYTHLTLPTNREV